MSKIICGILLAAALVYALYLVVTRRNLAKIKDSLKGKNAFTLAVFICCAMIMIAVNGKDKVILKKVISCYDAPPSVQQELKLVNLLRSAWLVLDSRQTEEFSKRLNEAIQKGLLEKKLSDIIAFTYSELSSYVALKNGQMTCYGAHYYGDIRIGSTKKILEQLELLNKMKREDKLDGTTVKKIEESIAYDIETLMEFRNRPEDKTVDEYFTELRERYKNNEIKPVENVNNAAGIIVEMEKTREKWDLIKERKKRSP